MPSDMATENVENIPKAMTKPAEDYETDTEDDFVDENSKVSTSIISVFPEARIPEARPEARESLPEKIFTQSDAAKKLQRIPYGYIPRFFKSGKKPLIPQGFVDKLPFSAKPSLPGELPTFLGKTVPCDSQMLVNFALLCGLTRFGPRFDDTLQPSEPLSKLIEGDFWHNNLGMVACLSDGPWFGCQTVISAYAPSRPLDGKVESLFDVEWKLLKDSFYFLTIEEMDALYSKRFTCQLLTTRFYSAVNSNREFRGTLPHNGPFLALIPDLLLSKMMAENIPGATKTLKCSSRISTFNHKDKSPSPSPSSSSASPPTSPLSDLFDVCDQIEDMEDVDDIIPFADGYLVGSKRSFSESGLQTDEPNKSRKTSLDSSPSTTVKDCPLPVTSCPQPILDASPVVTSSAKSIEPSVVKPPMLDNGLLTRSRSRSSSPSTSTPTAKSSPKFALPASTSSASSSVTPKVAIAKPKDVAPKPTVSNPVLPNNKPSTKLEHLLHYVSSNGYVPYSADALNFIQNYCGREQTSVPSFILKDLFDKPMTAQEFTEFMNIPTSSVEQDSDAESVKLREENLQRKIIRSVLRSLAETGSRMAKEAMEKQKDYYEQLLAESSDKLEKQKVDTEDQLNDMDLVIEKITKQLLEVRAENEELLKQKTAYEEAKRQRQAKKNEKRRKKREQERLNQLKHDTELANQLL